MLIIFVAKYKDDLHSKSSIYSGIYHQFSIYPSQNHELINMDRFCKLQNSSKLCLTTGLGIFELGLGQNCEILFWPHNTWDKHAIIILPLCMQTYTLITCNNSLTNNYVDWDGKRQTYDHVGLHFSRHYWFHLSSTSGHQLLPAIIILVMVTSTLLFHAGLNLCLSFIFHLRSWIWTDLPSVLVH